jgi:hypothetical protein
MREGALGAWWAQGARSAFFFKPDWSDLQVTPFNLAWLMIVPYALGIVLQRLMIEGSANFHWQGLLAGWLPTVVTAWACWWLVPAGLAANAPGRAPTGVTLFSLLAAQALTLQAGWGLLVLPLARGGGEGLAAASAWAAWAIWLLPLAWIEAATVVALWRGGTARPRVKLVACFVVVGVTVVGLWMDAARLWYPAETRPSDRGKAYEPLKLTQELLELQPLVLAQRLDALQPQRKGVIDLYTITFAPYGSQDVFKRESQLVADVMQGRFDSAGRTLQLVNHRATLRDWPWATPLNLQRAIQRVARLMDREQDVLFIHLTSHGASSGALSASFWPLEVDEVTPGMVKAWLEEAGIRYRIVSVSACHSGSWIEPLAGPTTLVMTASDIEHTSYGCGSRSELTFFGRAMYDEQLRETRSFEQAHAQARKLIEQREREAGKSDGYSNPQIAMGSEIRQQLDALQARLEGAGGAP